MQRHSILLNVLISCTVEWTHLCGGGIIPPIWRRNHTGGGGGDGGLGLGYDDGNGGGGNKPPPPLAKINECMLRMGICGLGDCVDKEVG